MTLKLRNILPFTLATILFAACTDELPVERTQQQYYFDGDYYFVLEDENASMSRMQYDGIIKSEFTTGDRIGIFAPQSEDKSLILNDVFSARDLKEPSDPPRQVLVPCDDEIKKEVPKNEDEYLLYFPHTATQSLERLTKGMSHTVKEDQSVKANLTDSDLLWCHKLMTETDKKETYVTINMHHAMATIVVKVAKDSIDTSRSVVLPSMPTQATGVILRKETEEVTTDNLQYNVETEKSRKDISMYKLPDDTDEYNYVYRAVVPACQTLQKDTDILTLHLKDKRGEYVETTYKLAQDVSLRPGKYYTFNLRAGLKPFIPDYSDDDSWVLDVYNQSGKKVGLLCREYIYYEPEGLSNYRDKGANIQTDTEIQFQFSQPTIGNLGRTGKNGYLPATFPASEDIKGQLNMNDFTAENMKLAVNSQAWVFYNLKADGNPDLTCGTVLRFIFDIKCGSGLGGYTPTIIDRYTYPDVGSGCDITMAVWPAPHSTTGPQLNAQGMFKTRHGHDLINDIMLTNYATLTGYAYDSQEYLEFYMHGGKVIWDTENYIVDEFVMPFTEEGEPLRVTTRDAEMYGHIAYDESGNAFVSYSPFNDQNGKDEDGNEVCSTDEKKLNFAGELYPLRKIGYNHFWIAKSLHSRVDSKGNQLECFSTGKSTGAVNYDAYVDPLYGEEDLTAEPGEGMKFSKTDKLPPGYIYPSVQKGDGITNPDNLGVSESEYTEDYDTYTHPESWGNICFLYNVTCIADGSLIPYNTPTNEDWRIPTWKDMAIMRRYGGHSFAARWITDEIRTRVNDRQFAESIPYALERGWLIGTAAFCANISGLDLKPFGCKIPTEADEGRGKTSDFGVRPHFFIDSETDNLFESEQKDNTTWFEIFRFSPWDCWGSNRLLNYRTVGHTTTSHTDPVMVAKGNSRVFAPVRLIMSYKNPIGPAANNARIQKARSMMKVAPIKRETSKVVNVNIIKSAAEK